MVYRAEKWNIRRSELFKENFGDFMTTEEEYDDFNFDDEENDGDVDKDIVKDDSEE